MPESVIVKALTTEAPIKPVDGVMMPTLEKMLVDINADPDFYYLQGNETFNIMQNARSLYSIPRDNLDRCFCLISFLICQSRPESEISS